MIDKHKKPSKQEISEIAIDFGLSSRFKYCFVSTNLSRIERLIDDDELHIFLF